MRLKLREHDALNYKTEKEPVLATELGPLACPIRGARPPSLSYPRRSAP